MPFKVGLLWKLNKLKPYNFIIESMSLITPLEMLRCQKIYQQSHRTQDMNTWHGSYMCFMVLLASWKVWTLKQKFMLIMGSHTAFCLDSCPYASFSKKSQGYSTLEAPKQFWSTLNKQVNCSCSTHIALINCSEKNNWDQMSILWVNLE